MVTKAHQYPSNATRWKRRGNSTLFHVVSFIIKKKVGLSIKDFVKLPILNQISKVTRNCKSCVSHTEFVLFLFLHQWWLSLAKRFHASIGKMFGRGLQVQVQPCIERPYYFLYVRQTLGKSS